MDNINKIADIDPKSFYNIETVPNSIIGTNFTTPFPLLASYSYGRRGSTTVCGVKGSPEYWNSIMYIIDKTYELFFDPCRKGFRKSKKTMFNEFVKNVYGNWKSLINPVDAEDKKSIGFSNTCLLIILRFYEYISTDFFDKLLDDMYDENKYKIAVIMMLEKNQEFQIFKCIHYHSAQKFPNIRQYLINQRLTDDNIDSLIQHSNIIGIDKLADSICAKDTKNMHDNINSFIEFIQNAKIVLTSNLFRCICKNYPTGKKYKNIHGRIDSYSAEDYDIFIDNLKKIGFSLDREQLCILITQTNILDHLTFEQFDKIKNKFFPEIDINKEFVIKYLHKDTKYYYTIINKYVNLNDIFFAIYDNYVTVCTIIETLTHENILFLLSLNYNIGLSDCKDLRIFENYVIIYLVNNVVKNAENIINNIYTFCDFDKLVIMWKYKLFPKRNIINFSLGYQKSEIANNIICNKIIPADTHIPFRDSPPFNYRIKCYESIKKEDMHKNIFVERVGYFSAYDILKNGIFITKEIFDAMILAKNSIQLIILLHLSSKYDYIKYYADYDIMNRNNIEKSRLWFIEMVIKQNYSLKFCDDISSFGTNFDYNDVFEYIDDDLVKGHMVNVKIDYDQLLTTCDKELKQDLIRVNNHPVTTNDIWNSHTEEIWIINSYKKNKQ